MRENLVAALPHLQMVSVDPGVRGRAATAFRAAGYTVEELFRPRDAARLLDAPGAATLHLVADELPAWPLSGCEAMALLRSQGASPILALLAESTDVRFGAAFRAGADDAVASPFDAQELAARTEHLRQRQPEDPGRPVLRSGPLTLDRDAFTARYEGLELHLTPSEITVLEVLLGSPGAVLSCRQLGARLWGHDASTRNSVQRHVSSLRRKLVQVGCDDLVTRHGIGYVLLRQQIASREAAPV